jgi:mRNA interferase RelE/StbE
MTPEPRIELASRAVRDVRKMDPQERRRIQRGIQDLAAGAENADVKAIAGRPPWLRMRVGDWRVLYRPMTEQEAAGGGILIARVIARRDLERSVRLLP